MAEHHFKRTGRQWQLACLAWLMLLSPLCQGTESKPTLALAIIDGLLYEHYPHLAYNQLLNYLDLTETKGYKRHFFPIARAYKLFRDKAFDCVFPASAKYLNGEGALLETIPVNYSKSYLFTLVPTNFSDLMLDKRKIIGKIRGYTYGNTVDRFAQHSSIDVATNEQLIQLMLKGRADAIIAYAPDIFIIAERYKIRQLHYPVNQPLSVHNESFVCHSSEPSKRFIQSLDRDIRLMEQSSMLEQILGSNRLSKD